MEELVVLIFVGLILLVNALIKKALSGEQGKRQSSAGGPSGEQRGTYEAPEGQVKQFLDQIQRKTQAAEEQQKRAAQNTRRTSYEQTSPEWASERKSKERQEEEEADRTRELQFKPSQKMTRKSRRQPGKSRARQSTAMSLPGLGASGYGKRSTAAGLNAERKDLADAVIWSEILRPPVSLRRQIGHRPIDTAN